MDLLNHKIRQLREMPAPIRFAACARVAAWAATPVLVMVLAACTPVGRDHDPDASPAHMQGLVDSRESRVIVFEGLDVAMPLTNAFHVIRCDGPVEDIEAHTREILSELGRADAELTFTNPGRFGRQACVVLPDGRTCSFIWVLADPDPVVVAGRLNHEKFHALHALQPESAAALTERAKALGYDIDIATLDEELAAVTVEILTYYSLGKRYVYGTGEVTKAVALLENARKRKSAPR